MSKKEGKSLDEVMGGCSISMREDTKDEYI